MSDIFGKLELYFHNLKIFNIVWIYLEYYSIHGGLAQNFLFITLLFHFVIWPGVGIDFGLGWAKLSTSYTYLFHPLALQRRHAWLAFQLPHLYLTITINIVQNCWCPEVVFFFLCLFLRHPYTSLFRTKFRI